MSRRTRYAWLSVAVLVGLCGMTSAYADNSTLEPYEEFGKHLRAAQEVAPLKSDVFGDQVSLYNGATEFDVTDFAIPGNNALPVALGRHFSIDDRRKDPGYLGGFGEWDIEIPHIEAVVTTQNGWTLNGGSSARCSDTVDQLNTRVNSAVGLIPAPLETVWDGDQLHVPGAGDQELLINNQSKSPAYASRGTYKWVTKGNWKISCLASTANGYPGEAFVAVSPSGVSYTFNWAVVHTAPTLLVETIQVSGSPVQVLADRQRVFLLATKVQDRFGNTVTYSYDSSNHLTGITSSDGRSLTLTWNGANIASASSALGTWSYTYGTDAQGRAMLSAVTRPDGSKWTYSATGVLETYKPPGGHGDPPPPPDHCQLTPYANTGDFVYTVGAPSGAIATFHFEYLRNYRIGVPLSCPDRNPNHLYPQVYTFFDNFSLVSKTITGPGLPSMTWSYNTGGVLDDQSGYAPGYFSATIPYDPYTLVYLPGGSCGSGGTGRTVTITGPTSVTKYTFGNVYGCDDGQLFDTEVDDLSGHALKTSTSVYVDETQAPTEPFPSVAGEDQLGNDVHPMGNRLRPTLSTQIAQDGATFTSAVNSFDAFARSISETASSSLGYSKTEATVYSDNLTAWVLGQIASSSVNGIVASSATYDATTALPLTSYAFGKLIATKTWNADGTLASITDGNNHKTTLSSWYRGIPRSVAYADGKTQSALVNDAGWITAVTDENGYATGYGYDAMGRLASIAYPSGDDVAWNATTRTFAQVGSTEYGIPGGHWKQTVHTGNGYAVTYYDALWRPLVTDSYDAGNVAATRSVSVTRYDAGGRAIFASYPLSSVSSYATVNSGAHTFYDALDRVTEVDQDSELGTLKTLTAYLAGFKTQVTDPRGYATTTSYLAYDAPSTDAPVSIVSPESETTAITRDVFGKPLKLVRSGPYGGSTLTMTRSYVYDANQQLCKRIDPESGATVMAYDLAGNLQWSAAGLYLPGTTTCDSSTAYASGRRVDRTYDARNRLLTLTFPDHQGDQTWTYTPDGQPASIATNNAGANTGVTNNYYYDKRRLLTAQLQSAYYDYGPYTWPIGYAYDANGHRASFSDPTGAGYGYAPNALGQPTAILGTNGTRYVSGVSYFPDGKLMSYTAGNGVVYSMSENTRLLPSRSTFAGAQGQPASYDSLYSYDADGDITGINDAARTHFNRTLSYDGLDRMTGFFSSAISFGGQYNYAYDPLDNLRSNQHVGGSTSTYNYDVANRLTSLTNTATGTTSFSYDVQGNLASKNGVTYQFDYGNRLRSDSINAETFRYDGLGHRQRADSTSLGEILWLTGRDGKPVWMANRREGGIQHVYLYLGNQLVATQIYDAASNPVLYQTTDTLGSVIAQTNQDAWVDHFNYYQAWGGLQSGSLDDGPGYANQINDTNTGLSYAQQRYYDPSVGRFMSMDPVDANTVTGSNFNRYVYANDNPYRFTDPDGRQECTAGREQTNEHCGPPPTTTGCLTTGCSGSANVSVTIVDNSYRRGGQASSQGATAMDTFNSVVASPEFVQSSEGIGDSLSLGATKGVRQLSGIGDVAPNSTAYKVGFYGSMVPGAGRLIYATSAKGIAAAGALIGGENGAQIANAGRNWLRITFRGFTSGYGAYSFSSVAAKYGQDWDAVISASGRTNQQFNEMGVAAGGASAANQATQCVAGQPGC